MGLTPQMISGSTFHGRRGAISNKFTYGVDYILIDPESRDGIPALFSRNRRNLTALWDIDHGGQPGAGRGVAWVREVLADRGLSTLADAQVLLLAQPRVMGHVFNPVSFWLVYTGSDLRAVIAEVTNTYGDRHSYLCHHEDLRPISPSDRLQSEKIFYVSPFQQIEGGYTFVFDISDDRVSIVIDYRAGENGVYATLLADRTPLTSAAILRAAVRRPLGSRRVLG
ncbi:MAG: DUF1365 domain-containing protein, partial [Pseudomonadota bacterium]